MGLRKLNADPHAHELLKQLPALNPSWNLAGGEPGSQNPAIRKDLAARTWGVFWYQSKCPVLFEIMVQIKTKEGHGVKIPPTRSFWCRYTLERRTRTETHTHISLQRDTHICLCMHEKGKKN